MKKPSAINAETKAQPEAPKSEVETLLSEVNAIISAAAKRASRDDIEPVSLDEFRDLLDPARLAELVATTKYHPETARWGRHKVTRRPPPGIGSRRFDPKEARRRG